MKFNCGPTARERWSMKRARLAQWHDWFAWRPVRVGPTECAWLETIQRRSEWFSGYAGCGWDHEYRKPTETDGPR